MAAQAVPGCTKAVRSASTCIRKTCFEIAPRMAGPGDSRPAFQPRQDLSLVVLNFELPPFTHLLWEQAGALRLCADGGANRLYDGLPLAFPGEDPEAVRSRFIPHVIKGDLDSIRPEVLEYYQSKGTQVFNMSEDQDSTDLQKCIQHILEHYSLVSSSTSKLPNWKPDSGDGEIPPREVERAAPSERGVGARQVDGLESASLSAASDCIATRGSVEQEIEVLVVGGLGGRVDHEFGNMNVLHCFQDLKITLLSSYCSLTLLRRGFRHIIQPNLSFEGPHCGLIPIFRPSAGTTTSGLRWDLHNLRMEFGALVSTSNQINAEQVEVESDVPLLWTTEIRVP